MNQDTDMQACMSQLVMQLFQVISSYAIAVSTGAIAASVGAIVAYNFGK